MISAGAAGGIHRKFCVIKLRICVGINIKGFVEQTAFIEDGRYIEFFSIAVGIKIGIELSFRLRSGCYFQSPVDARSPIDKPLDTEIYIEISKHMVFFITVPFR